MNQIRPYLIGTFVLLALGSLYFLTQLQFTFNFEQFFPKGDPDLAFFQEFTEEFEADDNFLLAAIRRDAGVFDSTFLNQVHDFTLKARELPHVNATQSLTKFQYPLKTPFAVTTIPVIHLDQPSRYAADSARLIQDQRFVHNFINEQATALVVFIKTTNRVSLDDSRELMAAFDKLKSNYDFEEVHLLGRPYFQVELVDMQIREVVVSAVVSGILVTIIMFLLFRRTAGILIALSSIALGLLLFMGFMGASGRELNAIAALYPVLMIIVGTSDVVHIMSKYIDELRKGNARKYAIRTTIKEIGLATLLTSVTTAVGFATLVTSRITPIRDFGINAGIGVLIAYLTVIFFTTTLLSYFDADQLARVRAGNNFWERWLLRINRYTLRNPRRVAIGGLVVVLLCGLGISMITTNYSIIKNLPRNRQITEDFKYFEQELTGFRPMEFAVLAQEGYDVRDYEVLREMAEIENYLQQFPYLQAIASVTAVYRSLNQMSANNRLDAYTFPETEAEFRRYRRLADQVPELSENVLVSKDKKKARITSRLRDIGADSIKVFRERTDAWITEHIDTSIIQVQQTGTGLIVDKNSEYVRRSLLYGLGIAILIVSGLMALLFQRWRMLLIALVPNLFPLLLAGALLGYLGIELEAGISIVFAVIFGIAVDDTIHFLSKYKLARLKGLDVEEAIEVTFRETGKAIVLTSIILFFGFLVMLFSIHPPSVIIGMLISVTLFSALFSDLLLLPVLLRWLERS